MSAQKFKPSGVLGGVLGLLGFSVIAGVLVTAMVTPALAVTSVAAKSGIGIFENLPSFVNIGQQAQQNTIYANRGGAPVPIATVFKENRKEVGWDAVSPYLKNAAVDGEDRRFFTHGGVDPQSIARALVKNSTEADAGTSGGSTLDMQLVKNILVNEAINNTTLSEKARKQAVEDAIYASPVRKIKEMKLAISLDKKYTKKEILLGYLNIVGMGSNTYGVESAAQQYFGVSAKDVTLPQAASLIAIVQQPNQQNLSDPKYYKANKERRDQILDAMLAMKHITQKQHDDAIATKIESYVNVHAPSSGCRAATDAKFACDYVTKLITSTTTNAAFLANNPTLTSLGATPAERIANWNKGGYQIFTSINLDLQDVAQQNMDQQMPPTDLQAPLGGAANSVEAGTGRVLVMVQNKIFDDKGLLPGETADPATTAINFSTDRAYGGSSGFPTGSTYKVFDLANWLQNGHGLNDLVNGSSPQTYDLSKFKAACDPAATGSGPYPLKNDSGPGGTMTVKQALIGSVNNSFMQMALKQDLCSIRDTAKSFGAHRADGRDLELSPATILGTNEIAPLTMAAAVATIGAGGLFCAPVIVDSVISPSGKKLAGQPKTCSQALTADVAAGTAAAMVGSMTSGTSYPGNPRDKVQIGGKTGTSPVADHVWIMGTTTKVGTAVWTGVTDGHQSLRKMTNPVTRSNYAGTSRFVVFKNLQRSIDALYGGDNFPAPSAAMLGGESATVPSVAGQTSDQAKALLESLNYIYADGGQVPSGLPAGRVVSTDPAAGTKTAVGSTITVYTSDGSLGTQVPNDITGKSRHDGVQSLISAGFSSGNISIRWVAGIPGDVCKVRASNPGPGQAATKTDPVTLDVSTGTAATTDPGALLCPA